MYKLTNFFYNNQKLIKFLVVGILNTIFGYSVYAILTWIGTSYFVAAAGSTILGVLFNFKSIGWIVFKSKDNSKIIPFIIVYAALYIFNIIGLSFMMHEGFDSYMSGIIIIFPLAIISYLINSRVVFKK